MSSANQNKPFSWNLPELSIRGAGQEDRSSGYENGLCKHVCKTICDVNWGIDPNASADSIMCQIMLVLYVLKPSKRGVTKHRNGMERNGIYRNKPEYTGTRQNDAGMDTNGTGMYRNEPE